MQRILKPLIYFFSAISFLTSQAQTANDIECESNVFYGLRANAIHRLQKNATSITDLGEFIAPTPYTINSLAFGNDITTGSQNRTFYTSTSFGLDPCYIMRYTG